MAVINHKLIRFKKLADFESRLSKSEILASSIIFIEDAKRIWTQGSYYYCPETIDWSQIQNTPNDVESFGITDVYTKEEIEQILSNYVIDGVDYSQYPNGVYIMTAAGELVDKSTQDNTAIGVALITANQRILIEKNGESNTDIIKAAYEADAATNTGYKYFYWGSYGTDVNDIVNCSDATAVKADFNGKANTAAIIATPDTDDKTKYANMGTYCTKFNEMSGTYSDWYVPAAGQLHEIYTNVTDINAALEKIGGTKLDTFYYYWSSSEKSANSAWYVYFNDGDVFSSYKNYNYYVRFVRDLSSIPVLERISNLENNKQDVISDLDVIRQGAAKGATAIQDVSDKLDITTAASTYATKTELNSKQNTLVSGTNIKTVNGESVLGTGDINVGVTGVKGNSETTYRTGQVNITKDNIGLGNVENLSKASILTNADLTGTPTAPTASAGTDTTQVATTAFVQSEIASKIAAADAMRFKGTLGTGGTITALPASHKVGDTYKVSSAGTYAGVICEVGDMVICTATGTSANNAHWAVIQANIEGLLIGPNSSTDANVAIFSGTTGKVIKDSGFTIGASVPANAKFTDTTYNIATSSSDGLMSSTDKTKLDTMNNVVKSTASGSVSAGTVTNIVAMTQAQYDALSSKSATTLYIVTD